MALKFIHLSSLYLIMDPIGLAICHSSCGFSSFAPKESHTIVERIVGGRISRQYSWPWQAVICQRNGAHCELVCGATLIDDDWLLTAAHCLPFGVDIRQFVVKLGIYKYKLRGEQFGEIVAEIESVHLHPKYDDLNLKDDVALIKLLKPVTFTENVRPICLSNLKSVNKISQAFATGFGMISINGPVANRLRQVRLPILENQICNTTYGRKFNSDKMLCAGASGKDVCWLDSGGPLAVEVNGRWFQLGIISWGFCAQPGHSGVYTKVPAYCQFIGETTGVNCSN